MVIISFLKSHQIQLIINYYYNMERSYKVSQCWQKLFKKNPNKYKAKVSVPGSEVKYFKLCWFVTQYSA